jgi:hypothetical protein
LTCFCSSLEQALVLNPDGCDALLQVGVFLGVYGLLQSSQLTFKITALAFKVIRLLLQRRLRSGKLTFSSHRLFRVCFFTARKQQKRQAQKG